METEKCFKIAFSDEESTPIKTCQCCPGTNSGCVEGELCIEFTTLPNIHLTCVHPAGAVCDDHSQCETEYCGEGRCQPQPWSPGTPCSENFEWKFFLRHEGACALPLGQDCETDGDCQTKLCLESKCHCNTETQEGCEEGMTCKSFETYAGLALAWV